MIAGCIERLKQDLCGGCDRQQDCAFHRSDDSSGNGRTKSGGHVPTSRRSNFLAFLGAMARAIEERAQPAPAQFRKEVEQRLEPLLAAGPIRIARLARDMGFSRQTFYRRLKAEEITFTELLDGLRRRLALKFIREEGLSVKEVAYRLGFSDPAAFSRAFKRWTGASPRGPRNSGRQD